MDKALIEIFLKMEKCYEDCPGAQMHMEADDLLIEAIRILAIKTDRTKITEEIIQAFERLTKWYE